MTSAERTVLAEVLEIVQRVDRRVGKLDDRLRDVETYITADAARNATTDKRRESSRLNRAQIIAALGIAGSFALGLYNALAA